MQHTVLDVIIIKYTGIKLQHILHIVPDLHRLLESENSSKKMKQICRESLQGICLELQQNNVPKMVAEGFVFKR